MSYITLAGKMLRKRAVQFRLFWMSQAFVVMLFFSVYVYYRTPEFMHHFAVISQQIVDSTNLGMVCILAFAVCFVPFSHWLLFQKRTSDFATLLSVGLSRKMMYIQIFLEHVIIDGTAAICGLLAGTGLAALYYIGITKGLGLGPLTFPLSVAAFAEAVRWILLVDGVSILGIILICMSQSIRQIEGLNQRRAEKAGFLKRKSSEDIYTFRGRLKIRKDSIVLQISNTILLTLLLVTMVMAVLDAKWIDDYGEKTYTFDLVYVNEVLGLENEPQYTSNELQQMIEKHNLTTTTFDEIDCYRDGVYNLFDVAEINRIFGTDYQVKKGTLLRINREIEAYWANGFVRREPKAPVNIPLKEGLTAYPVVEEESNILFGFPCMADRVMLLNSEDYKNLDEKVGRYYRQENYLISFAGESASDGMTESCRSCNQVNESADGDVKTGWQSSRSLVEEMQHYLGDEAHRALYARYLYEKDSDQNQILEVALFALIGLSLYGGSILCIHFWTKIRRVEQMQEYRKLFELGMEEEKLYQVEKNRIHALFWPRFLFPIVGAIFIWSSIAGGIGFLKDVWCISVVVLITFVIVNSAAEKIYYNIVSKSSR